jgi:UDP-N-acetylglucosamine diphosphorylase/glucosamine-1-phosphate N-acetyltransferase
MADLIVFEDAGWRNLLPLTYWRAAFDLRCGTDSLLDKIERAVGTRAELAVRPELAAPVHARQSRRVNSADAVTPKLFVNGRLLVRAAIELPLGTAAWRGETLLAAHVQSAYANKLTPGALTDPGRTRDVLQGVSAETLADESFELIDHPWQLVQHNATELRRQLGAMRRERAGRVDPGAHLVNPDAIHLGAGSIVKPGAVLDAEAGPIFVGEHATISPNATLQGPCFIGSNTLVQPSAIIREACSIGPACKVGGEIEGTIFYGCANKQHHGFLGHAYVGEWVNLGAGTVNSDLKNTYGTVRVPINGQPVETGQMFVGAFIGDHAKTGINVALPTGCVVGFAANVLVSGLTPKFVRSFSWLADDGVGALDPQRALATARKVMARRSVALSPAEEQLFLSIAGWAAEIESV